MDDPAPSPLAITRDAFRIDHVGGHWTADEKAAAFEVWVSAGGRRLAKTAELTGVPERTLYRWLRDERWHARYQMERAELLPGEARAVIAMTLGSAAHKAALRLDQLYAKDGPLSKQEKDEALTCAVALDRAGFGPLNAAQLNDDLRKQQQHDASLSGQSASALSQEERNRRRRELDEASARREEP